MNGYVITAILTAIGTTVLLWLRGFLGGHAEQKGANVATVEDIDRVHRRVEALRTEFAVAVERVAAAHGHRFQLEVSIYRELWQSILDLEDAAGDVWYDGLRSRGNLEAYKRFSGRVQDLQRRIRSVGPFFPLEMHGALLRAQLPVREMAAEMSHLDYSSADRVKEYLDEKAPQVWSALRELEEAIRARLWSDDDSLEGLLAGGSGQQKIPGSATTRTSR